MKIAIIGTGISGLTSAYVLNRKHDITVYEANDYIGGHTHTVDVNVDSGTYAVDTGFIVFNHRTYPNFVKLMNQLGVGEQDTEMSFGVKNCVSGLEYRASNLDTLFAQRGNLFKPGHWKMVMGMVKFGKEIIADLEAGRLDESATLGDYLEQKKFSKSLIENFIIPMGAAVWSAGDKQFYDFPVVTYARFMNNHGMLTVDNHPQWKVIKGGSRTYIPSLTLSFKDRIRLNAPVTGVKRSDDGVTITSVYGESVYDYVIIATHSDTALAILGEDATDTEKELLSALPYQPNDVVLHTDTSLLPESKRAWASWNYMISDKPDNLATLTYNMNMLQSIDAPETFLVTLNSTDLIDPDKILARFKYDHPVYSPAGQAAQARWKEINGVCRTWFAGAYWRFGFHEDGVMSGLNVTRHLAGEEL